VAQREGQEEDQKTQRSEQTRGGSEDSHDVVLVVVVFVGGVGWCESGACGYERSGTYVERVRKRGGAGPEGVLKFDFRFCFVVDAGGKQKVKYDLV